MTKEEIKILTHLHKRYPDPNATNIELTKYLRIETEDFNSAIKLLESKKYIKEITTENQKAENLKSWEITLEGALKFTELSENKIFGNLQTITTWAIILGGLGGGIAGVYYLIEILKMCLSNCC